jgi:hypothetical protein
MMLWSYRCCGYFERLCFSTCLASLSGFSCSLLTTYEACVIQAVSMRGTYCQFHGVDVRAYVCSSFEHLYICGLLYCRSIYPPLGVCKSSGALRLMRVGGSACSFDFRTRYCFDAIECFRGACLA